MPVSDLHREVATLALRAAARHGFALGGGNALIAHGVIDRPTQDVDLFTDRERGVAVAADAVEAALRAAGYSAEKQADMFGLAEVFEGLDEQLAEWIITAPDGREMVLQMAYFDRGHRPVIMEFGPVLDLDDVLGGKVARLPRCGRRPRPRLRCRAAHRPGRDPGSGSHGRRLRGGRTAPRPPGR
jgi:hypothetical protein